MLLQPHNLPLSQFPLLSAGALFPSWRLHSYFVVSCDVQLFSFPHPLFLTLWVFGYQYRNRVKLIFCHLVRALRDIKT